MSNRTVSIVHCPTSNLALGSGRMELERVRAHGVRWLVGTDVGAGPDLSMLDPIAAALSVHEGFAGVTAVELLHRATLGPAAVLDGRTEVRQRTCCDRPGALVVPWDGPPPRSGTRPESVLRELVGAGEDEAALAPRVAAEWV